MLDRLIAGFASNGYDIKAHWPRNTVITYIGMGSLNQATYLIVGDGVRWVTKAVVTASLHFHDDKHAILLGYNINFLMSETPVAVAYGIPASHKVGRGTIFANLSEFVVLCHNRIFAVKLGIYSCMPNKKEEKLGVLLANSQIILLSLYSMMYP